MSKTTTDQEKPTPTPVDKAPPLHHAALDMLANEAGGEEAAVNEVQTASAAADAKAKAESWAFIPAMFGKIVAMALPELKDVYSEDACFAWGEAMVPVAEKYGWGDPSVSVEVTLLIATVPMAVPTALAIKKYMDERKAQAANNQRSPAQIQRGQTTESAAPREAPADSHIIPAGFFAGDLKPNTAQAA
jgi:hypothetical protein